ncbi:hypothetical protein ACRALDRAFT_208518 [Sodiomyces alcalophilus JCM 7366]|uniref:uncharacterized protein n=1 Tax=Sodiomyces alcalophilus JCM 7366 TaxID=591952 RepID=UPI0039B58755
MPVRGQTHGPPERWAIKKDDVSRISLLSPGKQSWDQPPCNLMASMAPISQVSSSLSQANGGHVPIVAQQKPVVEDGGPSGPSSKRVDAGAVSRHTLDWRSEDQDAGAVLFSIFFTIHGLPWYVRCTLYEYGSKEERNRHLRFTVVLSHATTRRPGRSCLHDWLHVGIGEASGPVDPSCFLVEEPPPLSHIICIRSYVVPISYRQRRTNTSPILARSSALLRTWPWPPICTNGLLALPFLVKTLRILFLIRQASLHLGTLENKDDSERLFQYGALSQVTQPPISPYKASGSSFSVLTMYKRRQKLDHLAWDQNDAAEEESQKRMVKASLCRQVQALVTDKCGRQARVVSVITGGFNIHYRLRFQEGPSSDVMVRAPWPSTVPFPGEKTLYEAATSEFLRLNTRVPVPQVLHYDQESDIGPMLIIRRVENGGDMTDPLAVQGRDPDLTPALNLDLPESELRSLWGKLAWVLLELATPNFPRIGSLLEVDGAIQVAGRPLTQNMSNMTQLAHIPPAIFPAKGKTFATADEWYLELSNMHLAQLLFQHNDLISSEDDCRNKYVARQLFRRLAKEGRLSTFGFAQDNWSAAHANKATRPRIPAPDGSGAFRLWCDDFRPTNVLIDDSGPDGEVEVAAVIDWEFTYAAPTQFVLDPPWWLLFETPEMWRPSGVDEWSKAYGLQLEIWLKAMEEQEKGAHVAFLDGVPLSVHMRESWETGRFWLNYAARKSWAFDAVFWNFLDERFFGVRDSGVPDDELWKTRLDLLGREERQAMEPFVRRKMEESQERILVEWEPAEARRSVRMELRMNSCLSELTCGELTKVDHPFFKRPLNCHPRQCLV